MRGNRQMIKGDDPVVLLDDVCGAVVTGNQFGTAPVDRTGKACAAKLVDPAAARHRRASGLGHPGHRRRRRRSSSHSSTPLRVWIVVAIGGAVALLSVLVLLRRRRRGDGTPGAGDPPAGSENPTSETTTSETDEAVVGSGGS